MEEGDSAVSGGFVYNDLITSTLLFNQVCQSGGNEGKWQQDECIAFLNIRNLKNSDTIIITNILQGANDRQINTNAIFL